MLRCCCFAVFMYLSLPLFSSPHTLESIRSKQLFCSCIKKAVKMRLSFILGAAAILLLATAMAHGLHADEAPVLTKDFVDRVNSLNGGMWKASHESGGAVSGLTRREAKRLMGVLPGNAVQLPRVQFTKEEVCAGLPDSFDAAEHWPDCPTIAEIADQSACGSCWAVAAASAMSDRYCTIGGVRDLRISAADLLSCCTACGFGCGGGYPAVAWSYFVTNGISSDYCQPYPFPSCAHHTNSSTRPPCTGSYSTPTCNATCTKSEIPIIKYKGNRTFTVSGEDEFKRELYTRGPLEVTFTVYEDFLAYKGGVYKHVAGGSLGGHAVRLVGWGEMNGVPYWKIANSWNSGWGVDGYFFILRGSNECGIETDGYAGAPSVPKYVS